MTLLTSEDMLDILGKPPAEVAAELDAFSDAARVLSEQRPQLVSEHAQQWVGLYDGKVEVYGKTFEAVMAKIGERGYPEAEVVVKYIADDQKPLIV